MIQKVNLCNNNSFTTSYNNDENFLKNWVIYWKLWENLVFYCGLCALYIEKSKLCDFMMWWIWIMCYHIIYAFNAKLCDCIKSSSLTSPQSRQPCLSSAKLYNSKLSVKGRTVSSGKSNQALWWKLITYKG